MCIFDDIHVPMPKHCYLTLATLFAITGWLSADAQITYYHTNKNGERERYEVTPINPVVKKKQFYYDEWEQRAYYANGQLRYKGSYAYGSRHGAWEEYYPDGRVQFTGSYNSGAGNGTHTYYYETGEVRKTIVFAAEEEKIYSTSIKKDGDTSQQVIYKAGKQQWLMQYTPSVKNIYQYYLGQREGRYIQESRADGKVLVRGQFIENMKHGEWRCYDAQGNVTGTVFFTEIDTSAEAQNRWPCPVAVKESTNPAVFSVVEQMPEYPGGTNALLQFIGKEVQYPQYSRDNDIQMKVMLQFVVMEDGSIGWVGPFSPAERHTELTDEGIRVLLKIANFKPGMQNGKAVKCFYNLPLNFRLQ